MTDACCNGIEEIVEILIKHEAFVNIENKYNITHINYEQKWIYW